jgi:REP element-mobilizing transposase RayT
MAQSHADVILHIVFSTKERTPWIQSDIENELHQYICGTCRNLKSPVFKINGVADHIHLLLHLGKTTPLSDLISEIKSSSSRWIKTKGALQLMGKVPLISIFIAPPSFEELQHRLVSRNTDSPEAIVKRLAFAEQELQKSRYYDYLVTNDELDVAYEILRSIFIAEGHKVKI